MAEAVKRIQRKRTKGWRMPKGAIYVGRPTKWGNNYRIGTESHNEEELPLDAQGAVDLFKHYQVPEMIDDGIDFSELRGHDLVCWCPLDQPCHADVLIELANK